MKHRKLNDGSLCSHAVKDFHPPFAQNAYRAPEVAQIRKAKGVER